MSNPTRRAAYSRILVDINTQCDFLLPNGAAPVCNRTEILPNIRRIMNWARIERVPIVSSFECHRPGENSQGLPCYCVDRTSGQRKLPFTLMPGRVVLHGDNTTDIPVDVLRRYQQVIFTKRRYDFLSNPKADRLINLLSVDHFVIFGTVTELCIKAATLGLIARRQCVVVAADACGHWCSSDAELALRQMEAKGAVLVTTEELIDGTAQVKLDAARQQPVALEDDELPMPAAPSGGRQGDNSGLVNILHLGPVTPAAVGRSGNGNGNGKNRKDSSGVVPPELIARRARAASRAAKPRRRLV